MADTWEIVAIAVLVDTVEEIAVDKAVAMMIAGTPVEWVEPGDTPATESAFVLVADSMVVVATVVVAAMVVMVIATVGSQFPAVADKMAVAAATADTVDRS